MDTGQGYSYDASGNTTADAGSQTYTYDGENKMVEASNGSGPIGTYTYDGDGKRVKKYVPSTGEVTVFVYDASGKSVAEYSTIVTNSTFAKVNYLTSDNLGSPRINTDAAGNVISRHDYHPFGEEIDGTGDRTTGLSYGDDSVRKQFTGYERDGEVDLDFAGTRYSNFTRGRFLSPDPLMASGRTVSPKTWNRYTYVLNNPLKYVDPDGMDVRLLDKKATENLLKTLPEKLRDKVRKHIGKDGTLKSGVLDNIKSDDKNFQDLRSMVNYKDVTEVMTATDSTGENKAQFFQRTAKENKEYDIQNYMKNNNASREDAEKFFSDLGSTWEDSAYYGYTLNSSESPSGNLRIVVTDQTGEASGVSEETAVVSTGHELYGHGLLYREGKPYGHDKVPDAFFDEIEKRTTTNYRNGLPKTDSPKSIKPKQ